MMLGQSACYVAARAGTTLNDSRSLSFEVAAGLALTWGGPERMNPLSGRLRTLIGATAARTHVGEMDDGGAVGGEVGADFTMARSLSFDQEGRPRTGTFLRAGAHAQLRTDAPDPVVLGQLEYGGYYADHRGDGIGFGVGAGASYADDEPGAYVTVTAEGSLWRILTAETPQWFPFP